MPERPLLFSVAIPTRWGDEDRYGHINNVAYLRYFEEARVQWLRSLTSHHIHIPVDGREAGPVVVEAAATYLKPLHYPATVIVKASIRKLGNSSIILDHELTTTDDSNTLYTRGHVALVWVNHETQQPIPLPSALKTYLLGFRPS